MEIINKLVRKSRTTEVDAVCKRIIGVYEGNDWSSDTYLTKIFTLLIAMMVRFTKAIHRIKTESDLEHKDDVRDDKIRDIHYILLGALHHPDSMVKEAGLKVNKVFDSYGLSIMAENYSTETSLVVSMLADFEDADLLSSIAAISGLTELIAALDIAQTDFETTRIAFEVEKSKEGMAESASQVKAEVLEVINDQLVVYLRAMVQVDEATYGDFTRAIAVIISENNEMVNKRSKRM